MRLSPSALSSLTPHRYRRPQLLICQAKCATQQARRAHTPAEDRFSRSTHPPRQPKCTEIPTPLLHTWQRRQTSHPRLHPQQPPLLHLRRRPTHVRNPEVQTTTNSMHGLAFGDGNGRRRDRLRATHDPRLAAAAHARTVVLVDARQVVLGTHHC